MKKVLLGLVGFLVYGQVVLEAQRSDTIYAPILVNNAAGGTVTASIPSKYLIGQSGHQILLQLSDNGGGNCTLTTASATANLQGSYDNTNWVTVIDFIASNQNNGRPGASLGIATSTGQGLFPFLMVTATNPQPSNCFISLWYAGIISSVTRPAQTASTNTLTGTTSLNNTAELMEKGNRIVVNSTNTPNAGDAATVNLTSGPITDTKVIIDCIDITAIATATLSGGEQDLFQVGTGTAAWTANISLPSGSVAGTMATKTLCGIGGIANVSHIPFTPLAQFTFGMTNVKEYITVSFFLVAQGY